LENIGNSKLIAWWSSKDFENGRRPYLVKHI